MTSPLKTASRRPGRRCLSRFSLPPAPVKRSLASPGGWTSLTSSPPGEPIDDRASGTSVQHHAEQVDTRLQQVVRRLAGGALGSPGGVDHKQDSVEPAKEIRGPEYPTRHRSVQQHEVPAVLEASYCPQDSL